MLFRQRLRVVERGRGRLEVGPARLAALIVAKTDSASPDICPAEKSSLKRLGAIGLAAVLLVQVALLGRVAAFSVNEVPLVVGERLPFVVSAWPRALTESPTEGGACRIAFVCSSTCPFCARLASRYVDSLEAVTPVHLRPIWLILGDSLGAARWAGEHGLVASQVHGLSPMARPGLERDVAGDIWFTPTRVVFTEWLVVRDARPSDELLSEGELSAFCTNGGAAPQSIEDMRILAEEAEQRAR